MQFNKRCFTEQLYGNHNPSELHLVWSPGYQMKWNGTEKLVYRTPIFCGTSHGDSFFITKSSWYHTILNTVKLEFTVVKCGIDHLQYFYSITGMFMFMGCV